MEYYGTFISSHSTKVQVGTIVLNDATGSNKKHHQSEGVLAKQAAQVQYINSCWLPAQCFPAFFQPGWSCMTTRWLGAMFLNCRLHDSQNRGPCHTTGSVKSADVLCGLRAEDSWRELTSIHRKLVTPI